MQEEVNEKIITLSVQGARITASMVKAAMRKFLMELEREGQKSSQIKQAEKQGQARERGIEKEKQRTHYMVVEISIIQYMLLE